MARSNSAIALFLIFLSVISGFAALRTATNNHKSVQAAIRAKWSSFPLYIQASEIIATESQDKYWDFVNRLIDNPIPGSDLGQYELITKLTRDVMSDASAGVFRLSLALSISSPRCEMFRQLAINNLKSSNLINLAIDELPNSDFFAIVENENYPVYSSKLLSSYEDIDNFISEQILLSDSYFKSMETNKHRESNQIFSFDHIFGSNGPIFIVYADFGSESFSKVHKYLIEKAESGLLKYVLRPWSKNMKSASNLQGFGVELAMKNVEYKVLDESTKIQEDTQSSLDEPTSQPFRKNRDIHEAMAAVLAEQNPETASQIIQTFNRLFMTDEEIKQESERLGIEIVHPSSTWTSEELSLLALKAMQTILNSKSPLATLRDISQNLPTMGPLISQQDLDANTAIQLDRFSKFLEPGSNFLLINGQRIDLETIEPFSLLKLIKDEKHKYEVLQKLNISHSDILEILNMKASKPISPKIDLHFEGVTTYSNDLENDSMYARWTSRVRDLLRPSWPGQLLPIAKNFYTLIIVVDPKSAHGNGIRILDQMARIIYQNMVPIRLGYMIMSTNPSRSNQVEICSNEEQGCDLGFVYSKILKSLNDDKNAFITFLSAAAKNPTSLSAIRDAFDESGTHLTWDHVMEANPDWMIAQYMYLKSSGFSTKPSLSESNENNNFVLLNGKLLDVDPDEPLNAIGAEIQSQKAELQMLIYNNHIRDETNIYRYYLETSDVFPGFDAKIFTSQTNQPKFADLQSKLALDLLTSLPYFTETNNINEDKDLTHILATDLSTKAGRHLLSEALRLMTSEMPSFDRSRLSVITTQFPKYSISSSAAAKDSFILNKFIHLVLDSSADLHSKTQVILDLLDQFEDDLNLDQIKNRICQFVGKDGTATLEDICESFEQKFSRFDHAILEQQAKFAAKILDGEAQGTSAIISNGRIIYLDQEEALEWSDTTWELLIKFELLSRADQIASKIRSSDFDGEAHLDKSDVIQCVVSLLGSYPEKPETQVNIPDGHMVLIESPDVANSEQKPKISIVLVVDPLSTYAQKVPSLLIPFLQHIPMQIRLFLTPRNLEKELPLKNYYRYVFESELKFDSSGQLIQPSAFFSQLPQDKVLTLNIHTPSQWLVEPIECEYDLDNLLLKDIPATSIVVSAVCELENILVEGSCFDLTNYGQPPRGLQLILGDVVQPHKVDTLVMSNLGYFQLKANPGIWNLNLAEGRARDIYDIVSAHNENTGQTSQNKIVLDDFLGIKLNLRVRKQPGKEKEPLFLDDESSDQGGSFWNFFSSKDQEEDDTIHVFSVASGHLYERFLRIMMLSVKNTTSSPVKFWIIKNFLSPSFKRTIHQMADHFGFEVELVQYQWPVWLRGQTEKQRRIWGYKILFLDVLFPLSLKKVIFIDADQVVRTDLKQLMQLDLNGAPYGFTPFCTGPIQRAETKGFRFWDSGFWKEHLRSKPYHISALFVVDLQKFREIGAGDRLRATYDQLSRDPNSLANLDQDLPNYMQHHVKIFSLPREWLWCETWCTDESKTEAKTIDLCNNPLTKTPKLQNALRIIPEWTSLDEQARSFINSLRTSNKPVGAKPDPELPAGKDEL